MGIQILHQGHREKKQLLRDQMGGGAEFQGGHNLLQTGVKVQRRLVSKDSILAEIQRSRQVFNIVDH